MYDPKKQQFELIDTCFMTHHLQFANDANDTLWFSSVGGDVVGWLNTKMYEETQDEQISQGWTAFIVDTNGNGKRDTEYVKPTDEVDPNKDKRFNVGFYSIIENPIDQTIWGSVNSFPGAIVRLTLGSNPPETTLAEIFEPPFNNLDVPDILKSGNHKKIEEWKLNKRIKKTKSRRPDLYKKYLKTKN